MDHYFLFSLVCLASKVAKKKLRVCVFLFFVDHQLENKMMARQEYKPVDYGPEPK